MLKTPLKLLLAATIALPTTLAFSDANAGQKKYRGHNSNYYSGGYYSSPRHYRGGHRGYYSPHYSGGYYYGGRRRGHGNAGAYAGLALLGLGLGYAITKSNNSNYRRGQYDDRRYQNDNRYYSPPPPNGQYNQNPEGQYQDPGAYQSGGNSFDFSQCQETREYQTSIFIDGQEQPAFGTACLMADGSWVAGPMQIQ